MNLSQPLSRWIYLLVMICLPFVPASNARFNGTELLIQSQGTEYAWPHQAPDSLPTAGAHASTSARIGQGKALFFENILYAISCASCHGFASWKGV
jgi:hypothetical protein